MSDSARTVHIVDDDEAIRQSVGFLLRKAGYDVETYMSGQQFLKTATRETRGCVLLDVRMPEIDGLEVQTRLAGQGITLPVIMLTGHGDVTLAVRAVKAGAIEFLEKPLSGPRCWQPSTKLWLRPAGMIAASSPQPKRPSDWRH